jgi:(p)ppGpp synthase/HD superfamily hydrolase
MARDLNLVLAGLVHDTIEDTDTSHEELAKKFDKDVADLVREVTDDKSLPKAKRKELQVLFLILLLARVLISKGNRRAADG